MAKTLREQFNKDLYVESASGYVKDVGNFLMRGAAHFNPVVGAINKTRDWYNKPKQKSKPTSTPVKVKVKPETTKKPSDFTPAKAIGGAMAATALGLGAHALYRKYKKRKEKKLKKFKF